MCAGCHQRDKEIEYLQGELKRLKPLVTAPDGLFWKTKYEISHQANTEFQAAVDQLIGHDTTNQTLTDRGDFASKRLMLAVNKMAELTDTLATVMAPEWRDIGTLPKIDPDTCRSNDLLGYWPNGTMMVIYLDVCNGWTDAEGGELCVTMPTHWRPLPSTPEEESV